MAAAYRREIENAPDPDAHREMIENRLLKFRSPFRAAYKGDVVDLIDPRLATLALQVRQAGPNRCCTSSPSAPSGR